MEDEEETETYSIAIEDLPKLAPALETVKDLAAMQPLVLRSSWLNNNNYVIGTTYNYTVYSSEWVCQFCHYKQYAESDAYGNVLSHQGHFEHGPDCLWKRAKEIFDADA